MDEWGEGVAVHRLPVIAMPRESGKPLAARPSVGAGQGQQRKSAIQPSAKVVFDLRQPWTGWQALREMPRAEVYAGENCLTG